MKHFEKEYPVDFMCEVFLVSKSGYYAWSKRDHDSTQAHELQLLRVIEDIHKGSRSTYGSPRIFNTLKGLGHNVSKSKVEKILKFVIF